jgi:hypothetical protein
MKNSLQLRQNKWCRVEIRTERTGMQVLWSQILEVSHRKAKQMLLLSVALLLW